MAAVASDWQTHLNFFSRTVEGIYSKLATQVPHEVPD